MKRLSKILSTLAALALLAGGTALVVWAVRSFFVYIGSVPKEMAAALIAGAATVIVATLTITIGRYYERKKELDALYRDKKTEIYDEFLKEFPQLFSSAGEKLEGQPEQDLTQFCGSSRESSFYGVAQK
jgi:hypothetical protein